MQLVPEIVRGSNFSKSDRVLQVLTGEVNDLATDSNQSIVFIDANSVQVFFDYYNEGKMPDSIYKLTLAEHNWDPAFYSSRKSDHRLMIKIIKAGSNLKIIPDLNNNNSFDDHEYEIASKPGNYSLNNLRFENIMYAAEEISQSVSYYFDLIIQIPDSGNIRYHLVSHNYLTAGFTMKQKNYKIYIENLGFEPYFNRDKVVQYIVTPLADTNSFRHSDRSFYAKGDTVLVADGALVLDSVSLSGDYAYLNILDDYSMKSLLKKLNEDSSHPFIGKGITIVDIWATWCVPCLKQHEQYARLVRSYPNLRFIGILNDEAKNYSKARKYLLAKKYQWDNYYFENRSTLNFWLKSMGSTKFPQYIIIDEAAGQVKGLYSDVETLKLELESLQL